MASLAMEILGPAGLADVDGRFEWNQLLLGAPGMHVAGETDEVLKNVIGERVLGLPGDVRVDKDVSWRSLARSS